MIKAVIFDCFGVLTTDTWLAFLDNLPGGANIEAAHDLHRAYNAGLISNTEFLEGMQKTIGQTPPQVEDKLANETVKNTALLDYICELKKDYKIGLLSNVANSWITDALLTTEEQALFDSMIFSYQVGMTKPDPRIFILACQRLGVSTDEAVLVDDIERYCNAAKAEGLQAIPYQNLHQLKQQLEKLLYSI